MNVNLAPPIAAKHQAKNTGEEAKGFDRAGRAFEDALKGGVNGRQGRGDNTDRAEPSWKSDSYGNRLGRGDKAEHERTATEEVDGEALAEETPSGVGGGETREPDPDSIFGTVIWSATTTFNGQSGDKPAPTAEATKNVRSETVPGDGLETVDTMRRTASSLTGNGAVASRGDQNGMVWKIAEPLAGAVPARPSGARTTGLPGEAAEASDPKADARLTTPARHGADIFRPIPPGAGDTAREPGSRPAVQPVGPAGSIDSDDDSLQGDRSAIREDPVRLFGSASNTDTTGARVSVLGFSSAPSPAPIGGILNPTSSGLVVAIEAEPTWRAAAQDAAALNNRSGQTNSGGTSTLRIQLNPAELGMVTARLTAAGSQLSIEIQVESNDARQRLANDSDAILKALRGVGIDVEKVTIHQAAPSNPGSGAQQNATGRDQSMTNQQAQGDENSRGQGDRGAAGGQHEGRGNGSGEAAADRSRGGVYI